MRRVVLAIVSTAAALVLILTFKTHAATTTATPPAAVSGTTAGTTPSTTTTTGTTSSGTTSTPASSAASPKTVTTKTVTGAAYDTRYGPVQVRITVTNGNITAAEAVEYPQNDPRDQQINSYAIPALNSEAVQANSANIDMISGATFTSEGYLQSLQSAIDKAKA